MNAVLGCSIPDHVHRFFSASWWHVVAPLVPIAISSTALGVVLYDRRARLVLRTRRGEWSTLKRASSGEVIFKGVVEVYNRSSRASAIREYHFQYRTEEGIWETMESERYEDEGETFNPTPLLLPPYSGTEVRVEAIARIPHPHELPVRIMIEDLFGTTYAVEVLAKS